MENTLNRITEILEIIQPFGSGKTYKPLPPAWPEHREHSSLSTKNWVKRTSVSPFSTPSSSAARQKFISPHGPISNHAFKKSPLMLLSPPASTTPSHSIPSPASVWSNPSTDTSQIAFPATAEVSSTHFTFIQISVSYFRRGARKSTWRSTIAALRSLRRYDLTWLCWSRFSLSDSMRARGWIRSTWSWRRMR